MARDEASLKAAVAELEATGLRRKEAVAQVAEEAGVSKRELYNLVVGS